MAELNMTPPALEETPPALEETPGAVLVEEPPAVLVETSAPSLNASEPSGATLGDLLKLNIRLSQDNQRQMADLMSKALQALTLAVSEVEKVAALLRALVGERDEQTSKLLDDLATLIEALTMSEAEQEELAEMSQEPPESTSHAG